MNVKDDIFFNGEPIYLEPELWGPKFWYVIESMIISMDVNDTDSVENVYIFFLTLRHTIPCPTCRKHYQKFFEKNDIHNFFESKRQLFLWIFKLQNRIKKRNNVKPYKNFKEYIHVVKKKFFPGVKQPKAIPIE